MKEETRYFKVVCMCGHAGKNSYIPIPFALMAKDGKEAAQKARFLPRVKHHRKFAILSCEKITEEQYSELQKINDEDPYLHCSNIQEQRQFPEIIQRAQRIVQTISHPKKQKENLSFKYLKWKRDGRYNTVNIKEDYENYFEDEFELNLLEAC